MLYFAAWGEDAYEVVAQCLWLAAEEMSLSGSTSGCEEDYLQFGRDILFVTSHRQAGQPPYITQQYYYYFYNLLASLHTWGWGWGGDRGRNIEEG